MNFQRTDLINKTDRAIWARFRNAYWKNECKNLNEAYDNLYLEKTIFFYSHITRHLVEM